MSYSKVVFTLFTLASLLLVSQTTFEFIDTSYSVILYVTV